MCVCGCVCGSFRFDTAQTLVSRFLQVSLFFEDEGEIPVESDEIKVQTWSSQHYRNEPVVVVAAPWLQKYSSFHYQSGEQPLLLPIRSLKSRLSEEDIDVQSLNMLMSSKRFSSNSNRNAEVEADAVDTDVQSLNRGFGEEEGLLQVLSSTTSATATNNVLEISVHEAKPAEKESLLVESNDDDDDDDTETEDQDVEGGRTVAQNNDRGKGPPVIGGESSKTDGDEGPDVDKKADEFIAKRIESIKRSRRSARNSLR
ncbi:uncharacterized protein [Glycine max]|uniref:uncharacterized protein n=1 Tax=Glycine max TaxID=3847 RepID=UPI0003DED4FB|nr:uncharacterized protein LOC102662780 [Glycine max]|eukprot:XP_006606682.1 uncharacterized protein LOC102662780 [Glycine max]